MSDAHEQLDVCDFDATQRVATCPCFRGYASLRKPKNLQLGTRVTRLGDLTPGLLATAMCRVKPDLTENTLFALGGELLEACADFVLCGNELLLP